MTDPLETLAFDQTRLDKVRALREKGVDLYPPTFERKDTIADIRTKFAAITHDKSEESVATAGRLFIIRNHGKTIFADLGDESGRIQLYIRKADLGDEVFDFFNQYIERGDFIGVTGHVFRTKLGEITIWVDTITLLSKAVCPLPEKFHGLTDVEKRYRQRYVDLIVNEESRQGFRSRSRILTSIRRFLNDRDFRVRDPDPPADLRRGKRPAVHHVPQLPWPEALPEDSARTLPQAPHCWRFRTGL